MGDDGDLVHHGTEESGIELGGDGMLDGGPTLGPLDSMVLEAGLEYGFQAGSDGMTFTTTRTGASTTTLA